MRLRISKEVLMFWLNRLDEARLQRWAKAVKQRDKNAYDAIVNTI